MFAGIDCVLILSDNELLDVVSVEDPENTNPAFSSAAKASGLVSPERSGILTIPFEEPNLPTNPSIDNRRLCRQITN